MILLQTPFLTVIVADIEKINEGWEHLFWAPGVWGGADGHGREAHHLGGGGRQEVGSVCQSHDHV